MSLVKSPEMTEANLAAHQANGRQSGGPVTPEGKAQSAAANLRRGFYAQKQSRAEAMFALGEQPEEYLRLTESLLNDLEPRAGLEEHLVTQMVETLWQTERVQHMREGLAIKRIQSQMLGEELTTTIPAHHALENLAPFERLTEALDRRRGPITAAEIQTFVDSRALDSSEATKKFIALLQSLNEPLDERQRRATLKRVRVELRRVMEGYQSVAWRLAAQVKRVQSPENLAALMAPEDTKQSLLLQRMEDSYLRRLWRLTNMLMRVRGGGLTRRDVKNADRSGDLYENKGDDDKMSEEKSDICGK
jgi:hypothetical protein